MGDISRAIGLFLRPVPAANVAPRIRTGGTDMRIPFEGGVLHGKAIDFDDPPHVYFGTAVDGGIEQRSTYVLDRWESDGQKRCAYRERDLSDEELRALELTAY